MDTPNTPVQDVSSLRVTRRFQASAPVAKVPSAGGIVRVESWPSWWQPTQPVFFIAEIHCCCDKRAAMSGDLPPNSWAAGIFNIEYQ